MIGAASFGGEDEEWRRARAAEYVLVWVSTAQKSSSRMSVARGFQIEVGLGRVGTACPSYASLIFPWSVSASRTMN